MVANTFNFRLGWWKSSLDDPYRCFLSNLFSVCFRFIAEFIVGSFFFQELTPRRQVTCSIKEKPYASFLESNIIPYLQASQYLDRTIFMQNGYPSDVIDCVQNFLQGHFKDDRVISQHFVMSGLQISQTSFLWLLVLVLLKTARRSP